MVEFLALSQQIAWEIMIGWLGIILNLLKILIPLMIIVEILMVFRVIEKLSERLSFLAKILGIQHQSLFPLLVGVFMGVTYGAGTLIEINRNTPIPKRDLILIAVFLFICHAVIESSMVFAVAGANVFVVSVGRLFLAFLTTFLISKFI